MFVSASASSLIFSSGFEAFMTVDETSTPCVPSFIATAASSPVVIPAPAIIGMSGARSFAIRIVFVITSGFAFDTGVPVPMSSGGSIAIIVGDSVAIAAATVGVSAHASISKPSRCAFFTIVSISLIFTLCSLWFISVPFAPASFTASSGM